MCKKLLLYILKTLSHHNPNFGGITKDPDKLHWNKTNIPFHYTTNPTKILKTNSYFLVQNQIKGKKKKNCNIQFQLKKMLFVEVIDSLKILKWQILIESAQVKQSGHHQLVLKIRMDAFCQQQNRTYSPKWLNTASFTYPII